MKRIIALALLVLLLAGCGQSQYDGPKETISVLAEYTVENSPWGDFPAWSSSTTFAYNLYGDRVGIWDYDDGELTSRTVNTYDDRGSLIKSQEYNCEGLIDLPATCRRYTYDDQGRELTRTSTEFLKWGKDTTVTSYNQDGKLEQTQYASGLICTYEYDEAGNNTREIITEGERQVETIHTRNDQGWTIRSVSTYTNYELEYTTERLEYTYDDNGNKLTITAYQDEDLAYRCEYEYDDQGRVIRCTRDNPDYSHYNGPRTTSYLYEEGKETTLSYDGEIRVRYFNTEGDPVKIVDYDENGRVTMTQTYTYKTIEIIPREED